MGKCRSRSIGGIFVSWKDTWSRRSTHGLVVNPHSPKLLRLMHYLSSPHKAVSKVTRTNQYWPTFCGWTLLLHTDVLNFLRQRQHKRMGLGTICAFEPNMVWPMPAAVEHLRGVTFEVVRVHHKWVRNAYLYYPRRHISLRAPHWTTTTESVSC